MSQEIMWATGPAHTISGCRYKACAGDKDWTPELIEAVHQERLLKMRRNQELPPFHLAPAARLALMSLRVYLIFMLGLMVVRIVAG